MESRYIVKGHDLALDIVRALCILEIVGFWHMRNYVALSSETESLSSFGYCITLGVLSTFTFLSSYFLKKYSIESFSDVKSFYLKRFKRFWIPFFVASLSLHVASLVVHQPWYESNWHFLASILGLSVFTVPTPPTLWYLGMIMFFYILTPLVLWIHKLPFRIGLSILLCLLMGVLVHYFHLDKRTIYFMPMYILGLLLPSSVVGYIKQKRFFFVFVFCVILAFTIILMGAGISRLIILLICTPVFLISFSSFLADSKPISVIMSFVSYASMFMYLFHRHFYLLSVFLYNIKSGGPISDLTMPVPLLVFVVLPIIIVSCYYLQRIYDSSVKAVEEKLSK